MGLPFGAIILVYLVNKSVNMDGVFAGKRTMPLGGPEMSISGNVTTCALANGTVNITETKKIMTRNITFFPLS